MTHPASPPAGTPAAGQARLCAVVLTGGTAARMDGVDKASIDLGGKTLLERALLATGAADEVVVVGEQVPTSRPVLWTREDPPRGGPGAGILAGVDRFLRPPELVLVLAVDMPHVTAGTAERLLLAVCGDTDGAVLTDQDGRRQPLCAVYRRAALQAVRPVEKGHEHGLAVFQLLRTLRLVEVPAVGSEARDVDTWADLRGLSECAP